MLAYLQTCKEGFANSVPVCDLLISLITGFHCLGSSSQSHILAIQRFYYDFKNLVDPSVLLSFTNDYLDRPISVYSKHWPQALRYLLGAPRNLFIA